MRRSAVEMRSCAYAPLQYVGESHDHRTDADLVQLHHTAKCVLRRDEINAMARPLARAVTDGTITWRDK
jgi:hypothetical protein